MEEDDDELAAPAGGDGRGLMTPNVACSGAGTGAVGRGIRGESSIIIAAGNEVGEDAGMAGVRLMGSVILEYGDGADDGCAGACGEGILIAIGERAGAVAAVALLPADGTEKEDKEEKDDADVGVDSKGGCER